jgi:hypothetical protein
MRVLLSTYGSRGDVEPMAGLGVALQALGVEAVVSAPPDEEFQTCSRVPVCRWRQRSWVCAIGSSGRGSQDCPCPSSHPR